MYDLTSSLAFKWLTFMAMSRIITTLVCCFALMSCNQTDHSATNNTFDEASAIQVIDYVGNKISLNAPAERIVALAPHIVENVFSAGAGDKLIGVVNYSDYPEAALKLPIVGGYQQVNNEKIIELKPDLILAWDSGNSHSNIQKLKSLGFSVYIDQPHTLQDVAKSIRDIGILTNREAISEPVAADYLDKISTIKNTYRNKSKVSSFYQVWNQPLQTINGKHIISAAMEVCGGTNIYAEELAVAPIINIESVLDKNPQAIVASGMANARPEWLDDWLQWQSLDAVKNDNLFYIPPDYIQRHTLRILFGIKEFCAHFDTVRNRKN